MYQGLNPAVLKMIKMTLEAARKNNIDVIMCGEMAGDPINIPVLLGFGIRNLSMNAASIPVIKKMVREIDMEKARKLSDALFSIYHGGGKSLGLSRVRSMTSSHTKNRKRNP